MAVEEKISVRTVDATTMRKKTGIKELSAEELGSGIKLFLEQMNDVLKVSPAEIGGFKFKEFVVSAEIGASGKLTLLGTGVEGSAKGSLTFKFERS